MPHSHKNAGFTLVELAIVLMIIGLLIGGILRGQELMNNARVSATIQQTKAYQGALVTFKDAYQNLPGDIANPGARIPNCTTSPCNLGGNGDGIIGAPIIAIGAYDFTGNTTEQRKFWLHLAAAHMITGINQTAGMTGMGEFGTQYPAAKVGGGFHVGYYNVNYGIPTFPAFSGHFLTLQAKPGPYVLSDFTMTTGQAAQFDRKVDDGKPHSGDVIGVPDFDDQACVNPTTIDYNEALSGTKCNLLIRIDK